MESSNPLGEKEKPKGKDWSRNLSSYSLTPAVGRDDKFPTRKEVPDRIRVVCIRPADVRSDRSKKNDPAAGSDRRRVSQRPSTCARGQAEVWASESERSGMTKKGLFLPVPVRETWPPPRL